MNESSKEFDRYMLHNALQGKMATPLDTSTGWFGICDLLHIAEEDINNSFLLTDKKRSSLSSAGRLCCAKPPAIDLRLLESSSGLIIKEKASILVDIPDGSDSRTEQLELGKLAGLKVVSTDKVVVTERECFTQRNVDEQQHHASDVIEDALRNMASSPQPGMTKFLDDSFDTNTQDDEDEEAQEEFCWSESEKDVYAKSIRAARQELWNDMLSFRQQNQNIPWMVGGDFNVIRSLEEYSGSSVQDHATMKDFNDYIEESSLTELLTLGEEFTWGGIRSTGWVSKKLDWILFSMEWLSMFPKVSVENLNRTTSDHSPMLHQFDTILESQPRTFCFQNMWLRREGFMALVKESWELHVEGFGMLGFSLKLRCLKAKLKEWNKMAFGNVFDNLKAPKKEVQELEIRYDNTKSEAMARMLNFLMENRRIARFGTPTGSNYVSHLCFADDLIVFTRGLQSSMRELNAFFEEYEIASEQKINRGKSSFFVDGKCPSSWIESVNRCLGMQKGSFPFLYLGCRLYQGRKKTATFQFILDALDSKLSNWKNKFLSQGGHLVMINHVLSAIPIHVFAAIEPPKSILNAIAQRCQNFLWEGVEGDGRRHWRSWSRLTFPVLENGVGLQDFQDVMKAFSFKIWWKLKHKQGIWAKFILSLLRAARNKTSWKRFEKVDAIATNHSKVLVRSGD
ncbi:OLC1v1012921C1 [Oldenlandia corymbosa var. corymbosa]|uniref:OLC1v1012921C1 n=1 Tax=Oldenlandia corymbosa var. corymbosa TaxID=529605 RepID=A0AAV1DXB7_OLDCO|nr:OLC1v1012921C1 [Oldenlandia corymbosa var. corymbosa]